jgi:hypothetical protein
VNESAGATYMCVNDDAGYCKIESGKWELNPKKIDLFRL